MNDRYRPLTLKLKAEVLHGDCIDLVPDLGTFQFIFADPPFNIGHPYEGFDDNQADFDAWMMRWIEVCWQALCPVGVIALHGPDDLADIYLQAARHLGMKRIAWVNWHYRFGQCGRSNWIDARCHCLVFTKAAKGKWTWNPEAIEVASDRATTYADPRIHETENGGKRPPGTVWGVPSDGPYWGRVQGNSKERRKGHPNQLPEVYLARLVKAYTNPGDRVLDPFAGSGTTAVVCDALARHCTTCDVSKATVESVKQRVQLGAVRITPIDEGQSDEQSE